MSAMAMGGCGSLWSALAAVRDHRRGAGRRYPLPGLLLIAVAALLAGRRDQLGIVRWGRGLSVSALASLGLTRGRVPAPSVWCELFQRLDVASLEQADAARLLALSRNHWSIENRLHYVRDLTCREDQCSTRARAAPQVLAALRNTVLTIIRRAGRKPVEGFEHFAEHRQAALDAATGRRTE